MRCIDPHLHTNFMGLMDLWRLTTAGLEACVIPTQHMLEGMHSGEALLQLWRRLLGFEVNATIAYGADAHVTLSIPFYGLTPEGIEQCLEELPSYLKHERVVGMGEIGLDVGVEDELKLFKAQLKIANEHNLPVIVHNPVRFTPGRADVTKQIVDVIKGENFPLDRVVLDHTAENTVDYCLGTGAMVGLSVCQDKLPPEVAAGIVHRNLDKIDRILVNSELGYGCDGYFSVPRVMLHMRMLGLKRDVIEKVTFENPKKFFNLPIE